MMDLASFSAATVSEVIPAPAGLLLKMKTALRAISPVTTAAAAYLAYFLKPPICITLAGFASFDRISAESVLKYPSGTVNKNKCVKITLRKGLKIKEACPRQSWPLLTYEKHLLQMYSKKNVIQVFLRFFPT